jgi:parallel beta-helix repeat protein
VGILTFEGLIDMGSVSGAPIIVDNSTAADYKSIQLAIDNANPGDTIYVWEGIYFENVVINKKVTLIGNGSANTTIDGGEAGDVVKIITNNVMVRGFSIINSRITSQWPFYAGIKLMNAQDIRIIENNCSNNCIGIYLDSSESNTIMNNTCYLNHMIGIYLGSQSNSNNLINNTCNSSKIYDGIRLESSDENILLNNTCNNNNASGIDNRYSNNNRIRNNSCIFNREWFGILIKDSNSNVVENNNCFWNRWCGIRIIKSNFNTIANNTCDRLDDYSGADLIGLFQSTSNILINNTLLTFGSIWFLGEELQHWNTHTIDISNSVNGKPVYYWKNKNGGIIPSDAGQVILANCTNVNVENLVVSSGMQLQLGFSSFNRIINNNLSNGAYGITLQSSNNNNIINNSCYSNGQFGIWLKDSDNNIIKNNSCLKNNFEDFVGIGIYLDSSNNNILSNNSCKINRDYGFYLLKSKNNVFLSNDASGNNHSGIFINDSSDSNIFIDNDFSSNDKYGIYILNSNNSNVYFNNFLDNSIQGFVEGVSLYNQWDNGNNEGNYWSDYNELDNGAADRVPGDGIGDTEIPHLGLDNFPFINRSGWLYPGIPRLIDPSEFDADGEYSITWLANRGTSHFLLEEDDNYKFISPEAIYEDSSLSFNIKARQNGTYYYRIRAYSEQYESPWSNIVNITVDWPPNTPQNLTISVCPEGNTLNISWSPNLVDADEYHLYYKNDTTEDWIRRSIIQHPQYIFNDTDLIDGQEYHYKLQAKDTRGQLSNFTDIITAIPLDIVAPTTPTGLSVVNTSNDSMKLEWEPNAEDDLEGYFIYRSIIPNPSTWGQPIGSSSKGTEEYLDRGLDEQTTYYYVITAFDEVPNNSSFSSTINGTTNIGPHAPEINNSLPDININEDTIDSVSINLKNWFFDVNNDPLTYRCKGNLYIDVIINENDGSVLLIPAKDWCGSETITFYCSDGDFEISDNVTITVLLVNDPPETPEIISPINGVNITEGKKIILEARCFDPDLLYGDVLTYSWSSDISGDLGTGSVLKDIKLKVGKHEITLNVTDSSGNFSTATINIRVLKDTAPVFSDYNILLAIFIIIIIIVLFVLIMKKRTDKIRKEELKDTSTKGPVSSISQWSLGTPPQQSISQMDTSRKTTALKLDISTYSRRNTFPPCTFSTEVSNFGPATKADRS